MPAVPFPCHRRSASGILSNNRSRSFDLHVDNDDVDGPAKHTRSLSLLRNSYDDTYFPPQESPHSHRRVSFNVNRANNANPHTTSHESKTKVINLPWTDIRGSASNYTGEVNELLQPHGFGYLAYRDGTIITSTWCNGTPLKHHPKDNHKEQPSIPLKPIFDLGDIATPNDMQYPSPTSAFEETNFPIHSFAFIRRSNGQWTYAIVANRPVLHGPLASIRFVVDTYGSTKTLKRKHWERYIRLVVNDEKTKKCHEEDDDGGRRNYGMKERGGLSQECLEELPLFRRTSSMGTADLSTTTNEN